MNPRIKTLVLVLLGILLFAPAVSAQDEALAPRIEEEIATPQEAFDTALGPMRDFMFRQLNNSPRDIALFLVIGGLDRPETKDDIPTTVLLPAFILNEMLIAFHIGVIIYISFLIIDMVVASKLMAMGMLLLPRCLFPCRSRSSSSYWPMVGCF